MFTHRLDFGFGNPNSAGAFFAVLVLAVFFIPGRKSWMMVIKGILSGVFFSCLLLTASRGALIGLAIGSFGAWWVAGFPIARTTKKRWVIVGIVAVIILFVGLGGKALHRISTLSSSEGSTVSRIGVYRCVPAMLMAAPGGWGRGHGAEAYENWFQDVNSHTSFKNLLSTHATWIVEFGFPFFFFYLIGWGLALLMSRADPISFAVILSWVISCSFSHVGKVWWMWLLPLAALGVACIRRWKRKEWPGILQWGSAGGLIVLVGLLLVLVGMLGSPKPRVSYDGSVVKIGGQAPTIWFLTPDASVLGSDYGKSLRVMGSVAIANRWDVVGNAPVLVLSGVPPRIPNGVTPCKNIVWLNPPGQISPQLKHFLEMAPHKTIVWGGLRTDDNPRELYRWFRSLGDAHWMVLPGRGEYIADSLRQLGLF